MNERIKSLRKELCLTQAKFAISLGLSQNFIAQIESGTKIPSDRTMKDICREFNVNEDWLRTGIGDMFNPTIDDVATAASNITDSDDYLIKDLIVVYQSLSQSSKDALKELAEGMYARMKEREEKEEGEL